MNSEKLNLVNFWKQSGIVKDENVLKAFIDVDRENFVLPQYIDYAYTDKPLPIIAGQTISQPTTVMIMTQALELKPGMKVLEIGAGSGYQAAIIAKIVGDKGKVVTIEIIPELAKFADQNLINSGIKNVEVIMGDGSLGYEKEAPYDRIIVTAACPKIPEPLLEQLKDNGIIIAPVGSLHEGQKMLKVVKHGQQINITKLGDFLFVPLKGEHGFE